MKKLLLASLICASTTSTAAETAKNWIVSYDCGDFRGAGAMYAEPELEGVEKLFAVKTTVTIDKEVIENPTYAFAHSQTHPNLASCSVAGAGDADKFTWFVSTKNCTKVEKTELKEGSFELCGLTIHLTEAKS